MRTLLFLILNFLVLFLVARELGVNSGALFLPQAFILVFLPQLFLLVLSHNPKEVFPFLHRIFFKKPTEADEIILDRMMMLGMLQGFIGGILGTIHLMARLDDATQIGKGFALMLLSIFYGLYPPALSLFEAEKPIQGKMGASMLVTIPMVAVRSRRIYPIKS